MMIIITSLTFRSKTSFYLSPDRKFPLDMAGFAINLRGLLEKSDIQVGLEPNGGEQDGSRMIVACVPTIGGLGACLTRKILNLDPLRLLLMQSRTRLLFNTCDKIITTLNYKVSENPSSLLFSMKL